jgi:chromosome segregation ATPase
MFNLFPRKKSVDEILADAGLPTEDLYKSIKKEASDLASGLVNGVYEIIALKNELQYQLDINTKLKNENKSLEDVLKSIQEDGTVEHNNAIKLREENVHLKEEIDNYKKGHRNWADIYHEKIATIDDLVKKNTELKNELNLVEIEQEAILAANHNMAQTLKEKNDRVTLLENALDRWSTKAKSWEKLDEELKSNISELTKEVLNLRHLKTENVELMERINEIDSDENRDLKAEIFTLKNDYAVLKMKHQIVNNDYSKCTEQRDEYKHQLNAANKEIEALKSNLRDYQDKYAESFSYNDMNELQKDNTHLKEENIKWNNLCEDLKLMHRERQTKLKTYNTSLLGQIAGLKEENEKLNLQVTALHKIIEGAKNTIDEQKAEIKKLQDDIVDYVFEKTEEAKKEANQVVETLRNIKTQGFEDYDPSDFVKTEKQIADEELLKRELKRIQEEQRKVYGIEDTLNNLPKSFPNEFQDEETTAENLEEKFDRGEDVMDYFQEPWKCPCNMCKHAREENTEKSWEETASDLALRVAKLEKKIEELTIAK